MKKDSSDSSPVKRRFAPKARAGRKPKSIPPKSKLNIEEDNDNDKDEEATQAQTLLREFNESLKRRGPKVEKKSQVVFGPGATSSPIRSFGVPKDGSASSKSRDLDLNESDGNAQIPLYLPSKTSESAVTFHDSTNKSTRSSKKEYIEPWDYNSYYPTVLPLRKPYSGNPDHLNKIEFGEAATNAEYVEDATNAASELGLMEENTEGNMFWFQFPRILPTVKQSASIKGKEKIGSSISSPGPSASSKGAKLEELPKGHVGKMLVYKSGAVKLKLGDVLYDVSPGTNVISAEDVVAINPTEKQCGLLGEICKRVVVSADINSLLNSVIDLG
ncbi:hypothetical protein F8388_000296 [Cannabis sativa]|uniref:DNA binding protein n=1 Tax=Cannabis sativa TaxID=3483 RepID=A0A7J6DZD0_CANSA|nr:hypothetical protein G4B88_020477 [Cannabis sativa]KAF4372080.1 hypothetical protein F8388_000296 [Cannabis sativa]